MLLVTKNGPQKSETLVITWDKLQPLTFSRTSEFPLLSLDLCDQATKKRLTKTSNALTLAALVKRYFEASIKPLKMQKWIHCKEWVAWRMPPPERFQIHDDYAL